MYELPTIILLAGGLGTRLKNLTEKIPKSLVTINNKPFIYHQLSLLKKNNIKNVIICTGHFSHKIKDYVGDGHKFGLNINYSDDGKNLLGTGGALKKAALLTNGPFFIMYGDSYLDINFCDIFNFYRDNHEIPVMTIFKNNNMWDKSNICYKDNKILSYEKLSKNEDILYIDYGLSIMHKKDLINFNRKDKFDMSLIFSYLLDNNSLIGYEVFTRFYEVGSMSGINDLELYLQRKLEK